MQKLSRISPLNWGLEGFYDVFLRGGGMVEVLPYVSRLLGFFIVMLLIAFYYHKFKVVSD